VLHRARCGQASFRHANLTYADFSYADLRKADLRDCQLMRTQLHRAVTVDTLWSGRSGVLENDAALFEAELWSASRPTAQEAGPR
jgi:uncharacterized protein YjbI with pentapeptide repeats